VEPDVPTRSAIPSRKDTIVKAQRRAPGASTRFWAAIAGATALLTVGIAAPAHAATQIVENPSDGLGLCTIDAPVSYGEWFVSPTPTAGTLNEVGFVVNNYKAETTATLSVHEGIAGDEITSQEVTIPTSEPDVETPISVTLEEPVPVVPGGTYSFQLAIGTGCPFNIYGGVPYGEGTMLRNGVQVPGDLAFRLVFETPDGTAPSIGGQPPAGVVGAPYSYAFAVGGTPAPNVSVVGGALPPGLTLSNAGVLSGTPTAAGSYAFDLRASNASGLVVGQFQMEVTPAAKPKADVALSLTAPAKAARNSTFTYTATVRNNGPSTAQSVTTDLALPPGVTFVSASAQVKRAGNLLSWKVEGLQNGQSQQLTVTVKATKTGPQLAGAGALRLGTLDPKLINNVAAALTTVK
jgi:uncharacterized repeat protein (TIGR01451 family)